jgi:hypothetical protein
MAAVGATLAQEFAAGPSNYRELLSRLEPGDTLFLLAGEYHYGLPLHNLSGSADRPILITGDPGKTVFLARAGHNTVSIANAAYLIVKNLKLDGLGLRVDGVKCEGHAGWSHHITLENLQIFGHGHDQQIVGISTKCPAWGWVIRDNVVVGAGTGIYLGNSDGSDPFISGLIEGNVILNTLGYDLQIKHQNGRPDLPGMPAQASATVIRDNVFGKAQNAATGPMARPNLLVGHWPLEGKGAKDTYWIGNNLFYENPVEALFQGEGRFVLRDNLFINSVGDAVHVQPHNDIPREVVVANNLVLASGDGIRVLSKPARPSRVWVDGNVVAAGQSLLGGFRSHNHVYSLPRLSNPLAEWERSKPGQDWLGSHSMPVHDEAAAALELLTENLSWPTGSPPESAPTPWWQPLLRKLQTVDPTIPVQAPSADADE